MDAIGARLVARGRDDAARGGAANRNWFAAQVWIIALLHRRIKGIHVHMDDFPNGDRAHVVHGGFSDAIGSIRRTCAETNREHTSLCRDINCSAGPDPRGP